MANLMFEGTGKINAIWKRLKNEEYRRHFLRSRIRSSLAAQIYFIRESRGWTQAQLAEKAGTKQPAISRMEKGEGALSIRSLGSIADAFDVGLEIKFVPHSQILEDAVLGRPEAYIPPFGDDCPAVGGALPSISSSTRPDFNNACVNSQSSSSSSNRVAMQVSVNA